jgi:PEP-CTERM motif
MRPFFRTLITVAMLTAGSNSANAAQILFDLSTGGTGNTTARTYTAGGVSLRVSAWNLSGSTVYSSKLYQYSGGLGAVSSDDHNGDYNLHTLDNFNPLKNTNPASGSNDFLVLQFSKDVVLDSAVFNAFKISKNSFTNNYTGTKDADATIGFGSTSIAWNASPLTNGSLVTAVNGLNSLIPTSQRYNSDVNSNTLSANPRSINLDSNHGNVWIVSSRFYYENADSLADAFKLDDLRVQVYTPPIPEPSTWAMMLFGFGLIGARMRRGATAKPTPEFI